jgi:AraC-like DNA-binding protein/quercetin dioxygenase-like cupin family protein
MIATIDVVLDQITTPRAYLPERADETVHVLHWVRTGTASIWIEDEQYRLVAPQAAWIPAHYRRAVEADPGSIVLPVFVPTDLLGARETTARIIDVPEPWHRWLLHFFALGVLPRMRAGTPPSTLIDLIAEPTTPPPPMPHSRATGDVARELIRHPSSGRTLHEWAEWANVSTSALRRGFAEETGLTFQQWRTHCRLNVAAEHLANSRDIEWTALHTGYTPNALSRAFRARFGMPPGAFAQHHRHAGHVASTTAALVVRLLPAPRDPAGISELAAPLPRASTPALIHDFSIAYWMYQGTATFHFETRNVTLMPGEVIWLPPETRHALSVHEDSIMLPLGFRGDNPAGSFRTVGRMHVPGRFENVLLHTSVATHTQIRPRDYDLSAIMRVLEDHLREPTVDNAGSDPRIDEALATIATVIRRNPADTRHLSQWAASCEVDPTTLSGAFTRRFGVSFRAWRATVRMSVACELLRAGIPPNNVARRVGYAHVSGFSRLFSETNGMSPRDYQSASRRRSLSTVSEAGSA